MADRDNEERGAGGGVTELTQGLRSAASRNPVAERLLHSAEGYLGAQSEKLIGSLGEKVTGATKRLTDVANGDAQPGSLLGKTAKNVAAGDSPVKAIGKGALSGIKDKVKGALGKGRSPGGRKSMNIEESIDVGVPVRQAYNRWTQFTDFPKWSKGVQSVNQEDPTKSGWNAKVFLSKRNWNAKIVSQVPDQRISWTSDGPKGTVDGVITFHELAPNLTRILVALEYHPAGLFEKTGNLWRAQGRRVRLDLKLYRRFVMMSEEEVEGWRGEIQDGDIVRDHDEVMEEEQQQGQNEEAEGSAEGDYDENEGEGAEDEGAEGAEDEYEDEGDYEDEGAEDEGDYEDEGAEDEYEDEDEEDAGDEEDYDEGDYEDEEEEQPTRRRRAS